MFLLVVEKGKSIPLPTSKNKDYHNSLTTHPLPQKIACTISKIFATFLLLWSEKVL